MNKIHPLATVSPNAKLGDNIEIGPYVFVDDNVEIGDGCKLLPHAVIFSYVKMGCTKDGKMVAFHQIMYTDGGPYCTQTPLVTSAPDRKMPYHMPYFRYDGRRRFSLPLEELDSGRLAHRVRFRKVGRDKTFGARADKILTISLF